MALTWSVGQRMTAARINRLLPVSAYKPADSPALTSDATVNADPDLVLPLKASTAYHLRGAVLYNAASATPGIKYTWSWTGTATVVQGSFGPGGTLTSGTLASGNWGGRTPDNTSPASENTYSTSTSYNAIQINDRIAVAGADITLTFMWSQASSSADALVVKYGSFVTAYPVG